MARLRTIGTGSTGSAIGAVVSRGATPSSCSARATRADGLTEPCAGRSRVVVCPGAWPVPPPSLTTSCMVSGGRC
jgi:hypothetical protein